MSFCTEFFLSQALQFVCARAPELDASASLSVLRWIVVAGASDDHWLHQFCLTLYSHEAVQPRRWHSALDGIYAHRAFMSIAAVVSFFAAHTVDGGSHRQWKRHRINIGLMAKRPSHVHVVDSTRTNTPRGKFQVKVMLGFVDFFRYFLFARSRTIASKRIFLQLTEWHGLFQLLHACITLFIYYSYAHISRIYSCLSSLCMRQLLTLYYY